MPKVIKTISDFEEELSDSSNRGKAYRVSRSVFDHYVDRIKITPISTQEAIELSEFLGKEIPASPRLGLTRGFTCQNCNHTFTFTDHFKAAVEAGVHSRADLLKFTDPESKHAYLVIDTDVPIRATCVNCHKTVIGPRCCYSTSSYAYA